MLHRKCCITKDLKLKKQQQKTKQQVNRKIESCNPFSWIRKSCQGIDNSFSMIAIFPPIFTSNNKREQIAIWQKELSKLGERIEFRENGLSYSRKRITNPWEWITYPFNVLLNSIWRLTYGFSEESPCLLRTFGCNSL